MAINLKNLPEEELLYGARTCQGCGAIMAARMVMKVLGPKTCLACPACCFAATTTVYPQSAIFVNNCITAFPATASTLTGMAAARDALGWGDDITILGIAGDGGTVDIGIQALSGAAERNDDIIYLCYDNEAYMNTGVQRSGSTPHHAWTTTTPTGPCSKGEKNTFRKSLLEIMAAHRVPYAATASVAYPLDLLRKIEYAKSIHGCRVLHVMAPCPTGWGYDPALTVELGKAAVESGVWFLAEYKEGRYILNLRPKELKSTETYVKKQRRFRHLKAEDVAELDAICQREYDRLLGLCGLA